MCKKFYLLCLWVLSVLWLWTCSIVSAQAPADFDYGANLYNNGSNNNTSNIWINTIGTTHDQGWGLIQIIKNAINRVLWMLSLIALILCLRWWFQIVTAWADDNKQKKWISVLKHAAIWLVIIWLAWFVVTIVFWLLRWVTNWASVWSVTAWWTQSTTINTTN